MTEVSIKEICSSLSEKSYCFIDGETMSSIILKRDPYGLDDWEQFKNSWNHLQIDTYMADGGTYRKRKYATLSSPASSGEWVLEPHQPHYQGLYYNNLNGGVERHYEPIDDDVVYSNAFNQILKLGCNIFSQQSPEADWHIETHQFRIEANGEISGKPTPEGIHRDGVDFILMMMINHQNLSGGVTTIYDLDKKPLTRFSLNQAMDTAVLNDHNLFHGVSEILQDNPEQNTIRDVLVATYRKKT